MYLLNRVGALLFSALLAASLSAHAMPIVFYEAVDEGGGLFRYDLTIDNRLGTEAVSGLLVLHGDTVFHLDGFSIVTAPQDIDGNPAADWMAFAPLPGLIDDLDFFSLDVASDVAVGEVLGGFSFRSDMDPDDLLRDRFAVELIGADSASQIPAGDARRVAEPSTRWLALIAVGLLAMGRRATSRVNVRESARLNRWPRDTAASRRRP